MSVSLSCKLVEVFAMIFAVLLQNQARDYVKTLPLNPACSHSPVESPRPSLWRTAVVAVTAQCICYRCLSVISRCGSKRLHGSSCLQHEGNRRHMC